MGLCEQALRFPAPLCCPSRSWDTPSASWWLPDLGQVSAHVCTSVSPFVTFIVRVPNRRGLLQGLSEGIHVKGLERPLAGSKQPINIHCNS